MRTSADFRKTQRRLAELRSRSEAAVATIWLVFYVLGLADRRVLTDRIARNRARRTLGASQ